MTIFVARASVAAGAAVVLTIVTAGIALANDTCTPENKGDCRNTAAVVGTGATVTVVVTTVIVVHRRNEPRAGNCEELMARLGMVQNAIRRTLEQHDALSRLLQQAYHRAMNMERDYQDLLQQHQGVMAYFLAAGGLALAVIAAVAGGACLRMARFFQSRSSLIDPGTRAFSGYLSELPAGSLGAQEAVFRASFPALLRMEAQAAARAATWRSMAGTLGRVGAGSSGGLFAIREYLRNAMEGDLAAVRGGIDAHDRLTRAMEDSRRDKRLELLRLQEEFDELRERILRDCGIEIRVTETAPMPPAPRRPVEGQPVQG